MVIQHNMTMQNTNRMLSETTDKQQKTTERLSSGYRINRAADDAAHLAISEKMRWQVRGLTRAAQNIQDGISLIQIADGAMAEISDMIHRMKELSVQAANDTNTYEDRECIQKEIDEILFEIDTIHERAEFNGIRVLDGGSTRKPGFYTTRGNLPQWVLNKSTALGSLTDSHNVSRWDRVITGIKDANGNNYTGAIVTSPYTRYQVGDTLLGGYDLTQKPGSSYTGTLRDMYGATYTVTYAPQTVNNESHSAAYLDFSGLTAANVKDLVGGGFHTTCCTCDNRYSIEFTDSEPDSYTSHEGNYIYKININNITNGNDLIDKITDVLGGRGGRMITYYDGHGNRISVAEPQNHFSRYGAELDANGNRTGRLVIFDNRDNAKPNPARGEGLFNAGIYAYVSPGHLNGKLHLQTGARRGDSVVVGLPIINCGTLGLQNLYVLDAEESGFSMDALDQALDYLSSERSELGAWQNRLEHAYANVTQTAENTQASESRIRDYDMAEGMVEYSRNHILQQAGMSILAQGGHSMDSVLQLLNA